VTRDGRTAALRRFLPGATRKRFAQVASFDEIPEVEITAVDLPRTPAAPPSSRSVQPQVHPVFVRAYPEPVHPLHVVAVPDGHLVTGGGVVLTRDEVLVGETMWDLEHFRRDFDPPRRLSAPTHLPGTHASIISLWSNNYFHWIFNALPRLAVLEAGGVAYDSIIVPETLTRFQRETLALLGVPEKRMTPFAGEHVTADRLIWAAPLAPINEPSRFLLEWVRASLGATAQQTGRRLYVSRSGTRRAANEAEVYAALKPLGFEFVVPERLAFEEQVLLFASADILAGPHGSNFVNAVFSDRASVLEFFQPAHVNHGVYSVLCAAGQDHWSLICEPVRRRGSRRFDDMYVPVDLVLESLEAIIGERDLEAEALD
jgi:capsular polysaccharide biosynthesis protein